MIRTTTLVNNSRTFLCILVLVVMGMMTTVSLAQERETNSPVTTRTEPINFAYNVEHDHGIGSGKGELRITDVGIEYQGGNEDEARHNSTWRKEDIKRIEIKKRTLRIVVYEASSIPIIPRKAPFTDGKSVRIDSEHEYDFKLLDKEVTPEIARTLIARFERPIATTVIPDISEDSDRLIFEIPVFHRHRAGGEAGILRVYEYHVAFQADTEDHSRFWRYSDIRDIGRLGRYKFEIATFEGQFATDGKSYIFDLKRPMTAIEYDLFWKRLYEREPGLNPLLKQDVLTELPKEQNKLPVLSPQREKVPKQ
ncbi:MAG: hypothetical protein AB1489_25895 [Acidobacteriota bacterium]